jgi:hypothetical protein
MCIRNFWPLDFDQEDEIYDSPAWDMPGHRRRPETCRTARTADRAANPSIDTNVDAAH